MIPGISFSDISKNQKLLDNLKISLSDQKIYEKANSRQFTDFKLMFLGDFIEIYRDDIIDYLETDLFKCFSNDEHEVLCLIDTRRVRDIMNLDKRTKYQRSGIKRRTKLESQYFYKNPLIHHKTNYLKD